MSCYNCYKMGPIARQCKEQEKTCYICHKEREISRDCTNSDRNDRKRYICGHIEHISLPWLVAIFPEADICERVRMSLGARRVESNQFGANGQCAAGAASSLFKAFTIVRFTKSNEVEAVPSSWVCDKVCLWPLDKLQATTVVLHQLKRNFCSVALGLQADRKLIMKELAYIRQQNEQILHLLNQWCERPQLNMDEWSFPLRCAQDLGRLEDSLQEIKDLERSLVGHSEGV
ncbi:hypothetical protein HPB48_026401 [Haemaphysalis longicornis]|uniref:CCHC-type domain-containing protein n=1 Tax=Haemaphysalis longicornis TaxID=44386 RepID=A0A9J6HBC0_HAELO|nr:hypothetical protein HPB48_026401 [Haemaphysalis longicornis]